MTAFAISAKEPPALNLSGRIPELDGIAIGMVLVHHYFFQPIVAPPATFPSYVQADT